jgi:hypothetical protein
MKLLLEKWQNYCLSEAGYSRPYSDPSKVKIVSQILPYNARMSGTRLFTVAEFDAGAGQMMKFGFYTTKGESVPGTEHTAGMWMPTYGINENEKGWVMKVPFKYAHPDSILAMVGQQLTKLIPPTKQAEIAVEHKNKNTKYINQQIQAGKNSEEVKDNVENQQIMFINTMFKRHNVYKKLPKIITLAQQEKWAEEGTDFENEYGPKSPSGSAIYERKKSP